MEAIPRFIGAEESRTARGWPGGHWKLSQYSCGSRNRSTIALTLTLALSHRERARVRRINSPMARIVPRSGFVFDFLDTLRAVSLMPSAILRA